MQSCYFCIMFWFGYYGVAMFCNIHQNQGDEKLKIGNQIQIFQLTLPPTLVPKCFFRKWPKCFRLTWGYFAVNGIQEKALAQAQSRQLGTWEGCKQQQDRRINVQGRPWGERRALSFQLIISLSHLIACIWLLCAMHSSSTSPLLNTHIKDIRSGFHWNCATIISLSWFN